MFRFHRILVPLDGSPLAEQALEPARGIAETMSAERLLLLRVVSVDFLLTSRELEPLHDEIEATARREAESYLRQVRERLAAPGVPIEVEARSGPVAESIIDCAHEHDVDLIVMSSHGRSGISRWVYGSVAEKVLRGAGCATLVVRGQVRT